MKQLLFILSIMYSLASFSQNFTYSTSDLSVWLRPQEEIDSFRKGKEQLRDFYFEKGYFESITKNIHKAYLTKAQLALLQDNNLSINVFINHEGKIVTLYFMLSKKLLKEIPEKTLRRLYKAYCNVKFDMSKSIPSRETLNEKKYLFLHYRLRP